MGNFVQVDFVLFWISLQFYTDLCVTSSCLSGELHYPTINICYWLDTESRDFNGGRTKCQAKGGDMAYIPDTNAYTFLQTHYSAELTAPNERFLGYWIGVTDSTSEGIYVTIDGATQTWLPWKVGDPNDNDNPQQDCVRIYPMEAYKWQDRSCAETAFSLCSRQLGGPTTSAPTTTSTASPTTTIAPPTTTVAPPTTTIAPLTTTIAPPSTTTTPPSSATSPTSTKTTTTTDCTTTESAVADLLSTTSSLTTDDTTINDQNSVTLTTAPGTTTPICDINDACCSNSQCVAPHSNTSCYCSCGSTSVIDEKDILKKIQQLIEELTVSKKNTSVNKRKYISVADNRPSARGIGYFGAAILVSVFACIVFIDVTTVFKNVHHCSSKSKQNNWAMKMEAQ